MTGLVLTRPSVAVTVMFIGQLDVVLTLGLKPHSKDTKKTQKEICKAGGIQLFSLGFACRVCFSGGFCLSLCLSLSFSHTS